jgi:hypothetical protein
MTVAPQHPPVHAYLGEGDPLEVVDSPFGRMEREKAKAMATGEFSGLVELSKKIRNDSAAIIARQDAREAELHARADALSARELQLAVRAAQVSDMAGRVGKAIDRLEQMRADAQEEPLATPPGADQIPGEENKPPEPALELEDAEGDLPSPGDLPVTSDNKERELSEPRMPVAAGLDKTT